MRSAFGFLPLASPLHDESSLRGVVAPFESALEKLGGRKWTEDQISEKLPLLFFVATGGTERKVLELWSRRSEVIEREPIILLAHPGNNSLPACLEVLARLAQDGTKGRIVFVRGADDSGSLREITETAEDLNAMRTLRDSRIGLVGGPSDWLVASSPDDSVVGEVWGPEVVHVAMDEIYLLMDEVSGTDVAETAELLASQADSTVEPSKQDLEAAVKVHRALMMLIDRERLDALAVRCFDLIGE